MNMQSKMTSSDRESIDKINSNLAMMQESELINQAQTALDMMRQPTGLDEIRYEEMIRAEYAKALLKVDLAKNAQSAFIAFDDGLARNMQNFHGSVVEPIKPLQRSLLQRLVLGDTRFANVNLKFSKERNKHVAETHVPLNQKNMLATLLASEAQVTELQLSFLLAMARVHRWSSWPALLLDDPTQHHDIVHASAVFDVLRDYIAEYGFQIILTTHDTIQARYLVRKLQNDNIPVSFFTFEQGSDGVIAKSLH